MFTQIKNNQQGSVLFLTIIILGGAIFTATFALGLAMKFAKSSIDNLDVYAATSACTEMANGYASMACDTEGSCLDATGNCVTCGSPDSLNSIGSNCYCELEIATSGWPKELESRAWCSRGGSYVYASNYVYYVTGGATGGGLSGY